MACLVLAAKDQELGFSNPTLLPCASTSKLFNVLELLPPGGSGLGGEAEVTVEFPQEGAQVGPPP